MLSDDTKIIEFNQYQKSDKAPSIIYADPEWVMQKIDGWKNNLNIHLQQKQVYIFLQAFQCMQYLRLEA